MSKQAEVIKKSEDFISIRFSSKGVGGNHLENFPSFSKTGTEVVRMGTDKIL